MSCQNRGLRSLFPSMRPRAPAIADLPRPSDPFCDRHDGNCSHRHWCVPAWLKGVFLICGLTAMVLSSAPAPADAQTRTLPPVPPRLSVPKAEYYARNPAELQQLMQPRTFVPPVLPAPSSTAAPPAASWQSLTHAYPGLNGPSAPMLLSDGTVLVHDQCSSNWYKLTPDSFGNYA